ncbi:MAG: hypothetical protein KDJ69_01615 [Nitratireductor sp.]|nr:hypothetical protein [Nitratireductor sp.]
MVIDKIIDVLKTAPGGTETPGQLARFGFLEWMWSLSDDDDFALQAAAADARVAASGSAAPAVVAFRACLKEAVRPLPVPQRRGGARARRQLH